MNSINSIKRFFSGLCYRAILLIALVTFAANTSAHAQAAKPNILVVIGDDCTYNDLSIYGGTNVNTPRLEKFAGEGMLFTNAYLAMAMCQPCRTELYTGLYPMGTRTCWNHCQSLPETKSVCHHLGELGYRVGLAGKNHVTPYKSFPFDDVRGFEGNCVATTADYDCKGISEYMAKDKNHPFYLVVGLVVPHVPWTVGDPSHFDPKKLKLPEQYVDTPETRENYAKYLAEIEVLDKQLGDILDTLEASGQADNTIVIFTSEQGSQFPFCKWTNYNCGVHTSFVVRWPGKVAPHSKTDAMIQYADVVPTLLDAVSGSVPADKFDGTSFLKVLTGEKTTHRTYTYAMHNNVPEGNPYPIRSVYNGKYRYIRNLMPDSLHIQKYVMSAPDTSYWPSWMRAAGNRDAAFDRVSKYLKRPAEELYDNVSDPYSMNNLIDDPSLQEIKAALSKELDNWMTMENDPGVGLDYRGANHSNG